VAAQWHQGEIGDDGDGEHLESKRHQAITSACDRTVCVRDHAWPVSPPVKTDSLTRPCAGKPDGSVGLDLAAQSFTRTSTMRSKAPLVAFEQIDRASRMSTRRMFKQYLEQGKLCARYLDFLAVACQAAASNDFERPKWRRRPFSFTGWRRAAPRNARQQLAMAESLAGNRPPRLRDRRCGRLLARADSMMIEGCRPLSERASDNPSSPADESSNSRSPMSRQWRFIAVRRHPAAHSHCRKIAHQQRAQPSSSSTTVCVAAFSHGFASPCNNL